MQLFKYFSPQRTNVLVSLRLRLSQPGVLNDPFDSLPAWAAAEPEMESILVQESHQRHQEERRSYLEHHPTASEDEINDYLAELAENQAITGAMDAWRAESIGRVSAAIQREMMRLMDKALGMVCFTTDPANLLMWAHYAANHTGFVLGFDLPEKRYPPGNPKYTPIGSLSPVTYSKERPFVTLSEAEPVKAREVLLHKSEDWRYEQEWRLLKPLETADIVIPKRKWPVCLLNFAPEELKTVHLGSRISTRNKRRILEYVWENPKLAHVDVYRAELHHDFYELKFSIIERPREKQIKRAKGRSR